MPLLLSCSIHPCFGLNKRAELSDGLQSTPTPPLRGGPFHVQHSPGSPNEARGHGLHAAQSMPVMHMPSPRVAAHRLEPVRWPDPASLSKWL